MIKLSQRLYSEYNLVMKCISLGETPYPGMNMNEVYDILLKGMRMQPPIHCPDKM